MSVALPSTGPGNTGGADAARVEALATGSVVSAPAAPGMSTAMTAMATRYLTVRKIERLKGLIQCISFIDVI